MFKRKIVTFLILVGLILTAVLGWSSFRGKMYEYENSETIKQIEMYNLSYEIKLPNKVPFEEMWLYETNFDKNGEQVTVMLMNKNKDTLGIRISNKDFIYEADSGQNNIIIGKEKNGVLIPDNSGKRILYWNDEGINYEITYYSKLTPKEISKKQLVMMAESFK
ncbi:MAG: hypothetical protein ACK4M9_19315 [Anaerobacillus sp.]|uniref:hypothetical protein n=1 Tax=Anaerobacillus sp. TaxID=1872506 RepID=UPI00391CBFF0